ncbi:MAG: DNA-directed RNA polymerase subunit D [Candidatus Woesearchaeota archaeon]
MDIKLLEKNKDFMKITFLLKGVSPSYANSLRRYMINKVPTLAIEEVEFRKNNSALYDEIISHRLGLIPLTTDLKSYFIPEECKCKGVGCAQCQLKITLKAKGPKTVYASQMKSKDPNIQPVYPETPIVKLLKDQELEFVATAIVGRGKAHNKWSPCLAYYNIMPKITISKDNPENAEKIVEQCPCDVFELKSSKIAIAKDGLLRCNLCNACVDLCQKGEIKVEPEPDTFIFTIESWGQLNCKDIIKETMTVFDKSLDELNKQIGEIK